MTRTLALASLILLWVSTTHAGIIITLSGISGSGVVSIEATGSIEYDLGIASDLSSTNSTLLRLPASGGYDDVGTNVGDIFAAGWVNGTVADGTVTSGTFASLTSSTFSVTGTGAADFSFAIGEIRLDDDSTAGGDDIDFRLSSSSPYPSLTDGILNVALTGSAQFLLPNGNTFDSLRTGTYIGADLYGTNADQTVTFQIVNQNAVVPEPASIFGFATIGLCALRRLRRSRFKAFA